MVINFDVNYLAVVLAALVYFILGKVWYSPQLFGHQWIKHEELHPDQLKPSFGAYIGEAIIALVMAYVLAFFIEVTHVSNLLEGMAVTLWIWIGFVVTTHFSRVLWVGKSFKGFLIYMGFILIGLLSMGAVLMALR